MKDKELKLEELEACHTPSTLSLKRLTHIVTSQLKASYNSSLITH